MRCLVALFVVFVAVMATKEDMPMPGAPINKPTTDNEDMERAFKAVNEKLNDPASNNGPYHFVPVKILSAKSQVVSGVKHIYEVLIGESSCKKGEMLNTQLTAANCQLREGANRSIYKVEIWEQPWLNHFEVTNFSKVREVKASEEF